MDFEGNVVGAVDVELSLRGDIVNVNEESRRSLLGDDKVDISRDVTGYDVASKTTVYRRWFIVAWPTKESFELRLLQVCN